MGAKAGAARRGKQPQLRSTRLSDAEKAFLRQQARYEGSPLHKRNPADFGLTPPASPRADKTLCDEAGIVRRELADELLRRAIDGGLVSVQTAGGFPKRLWVVHEGRVFEAMHGGSQPGCYHGYPLRRASPWHDEIVDAWERR